MEGCILKIYELNTKRSTFDEPERKPIETSKSMLCVEDTHVKSYDDREVFNCICGQLLDIDHSYYSPTLTNERYSPYYICKSCYDKQKAEVASMTKPTLSALVEVDKSNENEEIRTK